MYFTFFDILNKICVFLQGGALLEKDIIYII